MTKKVRKGQSLVEYGLILAMVSVIAIAALQIMSGKIQNSVTSAGTQLETASTNASSAYCDSINKTYNSTTGVCE